MREADAGFRAELHEPGLPSSGDEPFSDMAMLAVLKRMNCSHITVHGFRATFATWAEECTDYPDGVREAALAHKYKSETTAAYQRGQKLEKRRALVLESINLLVDDHALIVGHSKLRNGGAKRLFMPCLIASPAQPPSVAQTTIPRLRMKQIPQHRLIPKRNLLSMTRVASPDR